MKNNAFSFLYLLIPAENMAWFEVSHLMQSITERSSERMRQSKQEQAAVDEWKETEGQSETYEVFVQYNPAG